MGKDVAVIGASIYSIIFENKSSLMTAYTSEGTFCVNVMQRT